MKNHYIFPAVLSYAEDGISVSFPDLPGCYTCAHDTETALTRAKDAMGLHLWGMEEDGASIPAPTEVTGLHLEPGEIPVLVDVFMPAVRDRINNKVVKKTLTIPAWLDRKAQAADVNFSQILQDGLKSYLGEQLGP